MEDVGYYIWVAPYTYIIRDISLINLHLMDLYPEHINTFIKVKHGKISMKADNG